MAGLGTTGVLIGSFFLLLTVGSTLVAFRGVPGQANNGDLSRIELRQQREAAARQGAALLVSSDALGDTAADAAGAGASGDVFGQRATGGRAGPTGEIQEGVGANGPDALREETRTSPSEKAPGNLGQSPAPGSGTGVVETPTAPGLADDAGSGSDSGSGTGSDTGSGSGTGSGSDSGSDSGTGSGDSTGGSSGSDPVDSGTGTTPGSSTGGATGTVGDPVEDTTGTVGTVVGTVSPGAGQTVTDTGTAVGGLLGDATSAAEGLTGSLTSGG